MQQACKFWDRMAKRYAKRAITDEDAYQKKLQYTRQYLEPHMDVLEFGCGTGSTTIIHAPYVKHMRAIDFSSKMIEIAQSKIDQTTDNSVDNITFEQSSIDDFSAPDQSLDVVLGLSILHLLENKEAVLSKIHNMLKPGGVFVSSTACLADTMKFLKLIVPIGKFFGFMPLVRFFTTAQLEASLVNAGFVIDFQWQPGKGKSVFIVAKKIS